MSVQSTRPRLLTLLAIFAAVAVIIMLFANRGEVTPTVRVAPAAPVPNINGFDYFVAAGHAIVDEKNRGETERNSLGIGFNPLLPKFSPAEQAVIVKNNQPAMSTMRAGLALECGQARPTALRREHVDYAKLYDIVYTFALDAQLRAKHGDWGGAVEDELDVVQMGQKAVRGSAVSGMLWATNVRAYVTRMLWESVDHVNAAQARSAATRLSTIQGMHVPYVDILREQKAYGQTALLNSFRRANWRDDYAASYKPMTAHFLGSDLIDRSRINSLSKRRALDDYTKLIDQEIVLAGKPYNGAAEAGLARVDYVSETLFKYEPNYRDPRLVDMMEQTVTSLLMTALALRAYRVEHGRYPDALSELVPRDLPAVPTDPFAAAALQYRKTGPAYVLYSIGPDGKDDGGRPVLGSRMASGTWSYQAKQGDLGDIVAGINKW